MPKCMFLTQARAIGPKTKGREGRVREGKRGKEKKGGKGRKREGEGDKGRKRKERERKRMERERKGGKWKRIKGGEEEMENWGEANLEEGGMEEERRRG